MHLCIVLHQATLSRVLLEFLLEGGGLRNLRRRKNLRPFSPARVKHTMKTPLMFQSVPPLEIEHDMRKVHDGAVDKVAFRRLIRRCYFGGMRREPEFFGDQELDLLHMARRLRKALRLEALLTEANIEYCVEPGEYTGGFLMKRDLTGAFFYVAPVDLERAKEVLAQNRLKPYDPAKDR